MRIDRLEKLLNYAKQHEDKIKMSEHFCGSKACLWGSAVKVFPEQVYIADYETKQPDPNGSSVGYNSLMNEKAAMEFFEISEEAVDWLFYTHSWSNPFDDDGSESSDAQNLDPEDAIDRLENFILNAKKEHQNE